MTKKRVILCVVGVVAVVGLFFLGRMIMGFVRYQQIISGIEIQTPNLSRIQDGTYNGFLDALQISANAAVTVRNHRITEVVINNHYMGRASAVAAEAVVVDVVNRQTLEVDTVSGATNSSKVILKAIQNALESGVR